MKRARWKNKDKKGKKNDSLLTETNKVQWTAEILIRRLPRNQTNQTSPLTKNSLNQLNRSNEITL